MVTRNGCIDAPYAFLTMCMYGDLIGYGWGALAMGAFAFWMFWEAKARYVAPYLLFLVPYSFMGYQILIQRWREKRIFLSVFVLLALVGFLHFSEAGWVTKGFKVNHNTESYYEYIHEYNSNFMNLRY